MHVECIGEEKAQHRMGPLTPSPPQGTPRQLRVPSGKKRCLALVSRSNLVNSPDQKSRDGAKFFLFPQSLLWCIRCLSGNGSALFGKLHRYNDTPILTRRSW